MSKVKKYYKLKSGQKGKIFEGVLSLQKDRIKDIFYNFELGNSRFELRIRKILEGEKIEGIRFKLRNKDTNKIYREEGEIKENLNIDPKLMIKNFLSEQKLTPVMKYVLERETFKKGSMSFRVDNLVFSDGHEDNECRIEVRAKPVNEKEIENEIIKFAKEHELKERECSPKEIYLEIKAKEK